MIQPIQPIAAGGRTVCAAAPADERKSLSELFDEGDEKADDW